MHYMLALAAVLSATFATAARAQFLRAVHRRRAASSFCTNIQWIFNRGITLECAANQYCPAQFVRRDQMAAFLNRFGHVVFAQGAARSAWATATR